jgi:DNA polymerase-3 subunit delta'
MAKAPSKPKPAPRSGASDATPTSPPTLLSLEDLLGQDRAARTLRAAVESDRVHHAWIFHGPVGVGKFTAAKAFAAALLDPAARAQGPARGESDERRLIREESHPDLHIVRKELAAVSRDPETRKRKQINIPLEVLREFLLEPAALSRVHTADSAAAKVFIVDQAELIDSRGQNALLKTLEEPPAGTVIILVTSSEEQLLTTIRSRSQRVAFGPLDERAMAAWAKRAGLDVPPAQRAWLWAYAQGAPGAALSALEHGLFAWHERLAPMLDALSQGRGPGELGAAMAALVDERATHEASQSPTASKDAANRAWCRRMLSLLAGHFRGRLSGGDTPAADAIDLLVQAEQHLNANVRFGDVLENLAAQLSLAWSGARA